MATNKVNPRRQNGARRDKLRRHFKALGLPCALCGGAINYDLPPGLDGSFELDEIIPVSRGGDPFDVNNLQAVHRRCNRIKGGHVLNEGLFMGPAFSNGVEFSDVLRSKDAKTMSKNSSNEVEIETSRKW